MRACDGINCRGLACHGRQQAEGILLVFSDDLDAQGYRPCAPPSDGQASKLGSTTDGCCYFAATSYAVCWFWNDSRSDLTAFGICKPSRLKAFGSINSDGGCEYWFSFTVH